MIFYLLDTNAVSAYARGRDAALVAKIEANSTVLILSAIVLAELE